jgi:hypothetical protein
MRLQRHLFLALVAVIFIACQPKSQPTESTETDTPKEEMKFKLVKEYTFELLKVNNEFVKGEPLYGLIHNHYDAKGDKVKDIKYRLSGDIYLQYEYKYDDNGNRIHEALLDGRDSLIRKIEFKYDNDVLLEDISYDKDGNKEKCYKYAYNEKNQVSGQQIFDAVDSLKKSYSFSYNDLDQRIEELKHNAKGELIERYTYTYDQQGNVLKEDIFGADGKIIQSYRYQYIYDEHNNWTQRYIFTNDQPTLLLEREIEYQ